MPLEQFDPAQFLDPLNPRHADTIRDAVSVCTSDCIQRPALAKPRKVVIELIFTPENDVATGRMSGVAVKVNVKNPSIPPFNTAAPYSMALGESNQLEFMPGAPDDHRQRTIDFAKQSGPTAQAVGSEEDPFDPPTQD